jgi:hypothetical protein
MSLGYLNAITNRTDSAVFKMLEAYILYIAKHKLPQFADLLSLSLEDNSPNLY